MAEIVITEQNFEEEVLNAPIPGMVDFWASWCGPCRMVAPIVAQIAQEQEGIVKVGKVNVDEQPRLAQRYGVSSIPTIVVFRDGQAVTGVVGARPKEALEALIDQAK